MACVTLLLAFALQAPDVLVYRNGDVAEGKIVKVEADGVDFKFDKGGRGFVAFADLDAYTAYQIKSKASDLKSGAARVALGDFCRANKLYAQAIKEYEAAKGLDASLAADVAAKIEAAQAQDAQSKLAEATDLMAKGEVDKAGKPLQYVIANYSETAWAKQAEELLTQLAGLLEKKNKEKAEAIAKAKEALEARSEKLREALERASLAAALQHVGDGKKFWGDGLDFEGTGQHARAQQAWAAAQDRLLLAGTELQELVKSNDIELIKQVKTVLPEVSQWLVRVYLALGQMHATNGAHAEAVRWVNQAIKIDPDNEKANALKLEITKAQLQKKP